MRMQTLRGVAAGLVALVVVGVTGAPVLAVERGQWWHDTWQMPQVWSITEGAGVTVGVIDTGVDASISELEGAVTSGIDVLAEDSGDGFVDGDSEGGGHGTAMASLIAGRGGHTGFVGVAPAAAIQSLAVAAAREQGVDSNDYLAEALRYAADNDAKVVNVSIAGIYLRGPEECPARVGAAVRYAVSQDVVVVTSAGNTPDGETGYPAACPGALTVGGLDRDLQVWEDSNRSTHVDVAAPAVDISAIGRGGEVYYGTGTSDASALVAGVVALVRAQFPDASAHEVVARLLATAQDLGSAGRDDATGHGMVRPYEALTADVPPDAPNPVYDGLDLTDTADPGSSRDGYEPPPPPDVPPPPAPPAAAASDTGAGDGGAVLVVVLVVAGGLALALTVAVVVLTFRRRSAATDRPASPVPPPQR